MTVSNSGPLIHLAMIGRLDLLKALFGSVIIPSTVGWKSWTGGRKKVRRMLF